MSDLHSGIPQRTCLRDIPPSWRASRIVHYRDLLSYVSKELYIDFLWAKPQWRWSTNFETSNWRQVIQYGSDRDAGLAI